MTEIVAPLTKEEALELTGRIRKKLAVMEVLEGEIAEAFTREAWRSLGCSSWDVYVDTHFGDKLPRLGREERQERVASLRQAGMSTRAIAPVVGTSHMSVQRDIASGGTNVTPDRPSKTKGLDGKEYDRERLATQPKNEAIEEAKASTVIPPADTSIPKPKTPVASVDNGAMNTMDDIFRRFFQIRELAMDLNKKRLRPHADSHQAWRRIISDHIIEMESLLDLVKKEGVS